MTFEVEGPCISRSKLKQPNHVGQSSSRGRVPCKEKFHSGQRSMQSRVPDGEKFNAR